MHGYFYSSYFYKFFRKGPEKFTNYVLLLRINFNIIETMFIAWNDQSVQDMERHG